MLSKMIRIKNKKKGQKQRIHNIKLKLNSSIIILQGQITMINKQYITHNPQMHILRKYGNNYDGYRRQKNNNGRLEYPNYIKQQNQNKYQEQKQEDPELPPLLDLSIQSDPSITDTIDRNQSIKIFPKWIYNQSSQNKKELNSIYIEQQQQSTHQTHQKNNFSTIAPSAHQNTYNNSQKSNQLLINSLVSQAYQEDSQENDGLKNKLDFIMRILSNRNTGKEIQKITLQTFAQSTLNSQEKHRNTKQFRKIYKNKSSQQILKFLFVHLGKVQNYLNFFIQQSIAQKKIQNSQLNLNKKLLQKYHVKGYEEIMLKKQEQKRANIETTKLLVCLMMKIKESSLKNNQNPTILTDRNGQICFNFGFQTSTDGQMKKQDPQHSGINFKMTPPSFKPTQNTIKTQYNINKQEIKRLEQKLEEQDESINKIKCEYEEVINNYAQTIQNLLLQRIQKNKNDRRKKRTSKNVQNGEEIDENKQLKAADTDKQLEQLIRNKNTIDPIQIFNRLSTGSRRKSKNNLKSQKSISEEHSQL